MTPAAPVRSRSVESELDSPVGQGLGREDGPGLAWTAVAVVTAGITLVLTNADSARRWTDDAPPSRFVAAIAPPVHRWSELTRTFGLPAAKLREAWRTAETARLSETASASERLSPQR